MKKIFTILVILLLFAACKTRYIPVESVRTEYRNRLLQDSVYIHDSTFVYKNGDSLFYWMWRTEYRDRLLKDTVKLSDTIRVPYPVVETKEINKLQTWQIILMILGGVLIGYLGYQVFRLFK